MFKLVVGFFLLAFEVRKEVDKVLKPRKCSFLGRILFLK